MNEVTLLKPPELDQLYGNADSEHVHEVVDELKTMHHQLEELPGQKCHDLLNDVGRSKRMLDDNYSELMKAFGHFENNPDSWLVNDKNRLQNALLDFTRKLHNYLAMCLSLRDHTYRVKDKLDRNNLDERYSSKMEELNLIAPASFVIDLRNYMQHRRIPVVTRRTSTHFISGDKHIERTAKILFDKAELFEWDDWSSPSHEVLEDLDDEFQIRKIIENFHTKLTEFYDWFVMYITDLYTGEIDERDALVIEMAEKQENLIPGINEDFLTEEQSE